MTDLVLLTDEEIADMSYDSFNKTDLVAMQSMQESEFPRYTVAMAHTIYVWENILYQEASRLCESYSGGVWETKNGFWTLQSDSIFYMENGWDEAFNLNALEFSIVVNLFALSKIAMMTYSSKPAINRRAVFFSDYIKDVIHKNRNVLDTTAIYKLIY